MITLHTKKGHILHLPVLPANDALTIQGLCSCGVDMFDMEHDCLEDTVLKIWVEHSELFDPLESQQ